MRFNRLSTSVAFSVVLVLIGALGYGNTYYVDGPNPNASNTNPGTLYQPWLTIQKAANMVGPGDTVLIRQGVYHEAVTIAVSGSQAQPIVFRAYSNEEAIIDGSGLSQIFLVNMDSGVNYVTLEGLTIRNGAGWGIWLRGNHNTITRCVAYANGLGGDYSAAGIFIRSGDYNQITYNDVSNNRWNGIDVEDANHTTVEHNTSHDNKYHVGINIMSNTEAYYGMMDGNNVRFNVVYGNVEGMYLRYQQNNEISNNLIYRNDQYGIFFHYGSESGRPSAYDAHTLIYNNTIALNGYEGIATMGANYLTIMNNVLYRNRDSGGSVCQLGFFNTYNGHLVDYNIYDQPMTQTYYVNWQGSRRTFDYWQALGQEAHGLSSGASLVDPAAGDFKLSPASIAIDIGADLREQGIIDDLVGNPRPQGNGFDMGAYEWQGPVPVKMSPPSHLRIRS